VNITDTVLFLVGIHHYWSVTQDKSLKNGQIKFVINDCVKYHTNVLTISYILFLIHYFMIFLMQIFRFFHIFLKSHFKLVAKLSLTPTFNFLHQQYWKTPSNKWSKDPIYLIPLYKLLPFCTVLRPRKRLTIHQKLFRIFLVRKVIPGLPIAPHKRPPWGHQAH